MTVIHHAISLLLPNRLHTQTSRSPNSPMDSKTFSLEIQLPIEVRNLFRSNKLHETPSEYITPVSKLWELSTLLRVLVPMSPWRNRKCPSLSCENKVYFISINGYVYCRATMDYFNATINIKLLQGIAKLLSKQVTGWNFKSSKIISYDDPFFHDSNAMKTNWIHLVYFSFF